MPCADYSIEENAYWSERVYSHVFRLLNEYGILMEGMLLKPNMCLPGGKSCSQAAQNCTSATVSDIELFHQTDLSCALTYTTQCTVPVCLILKTAEAIARIDM